MNEQPLDLKESIRAIWWRRRLVATLAGIGLVGGLAFSVARPPLPSAEALVLLPPTSLSSSGAPTRDVTTEIVIATSTPVLAAAGKTVSPPIEPTTLRHQVTATALSQDVLAIQVRASSGGDAERLANAVADNYIQFIATSSSTATRSALAGLQRESSQLTQQIQGLQSQINAVSARLATERTSSASGQQDSSLLGSLGNEQQQVSLQLDNVNNQVVTDQLSGAAAAQGTRILQRANTVAGGSLLMVVFPEVLGLVLGLVVGLPLAMVRSRRHRRLRFRNEIATTLAVPVLGSVEAPRRRTAADWNGVLEHYDPSSADVSNLRRVLQRLAPAPTQERSAILVLSFATDRAAVGAGPQLAAFAEELGVATTLLPSDDEAFASLRAASPTRPSSYVERRGGGLTVSMAAVDPAHPELSGAPGSVLLAVSAGFASADVLTRLAAAAAVARRGIDGVLVINPDPSDTTTGSVPDAELVVATQAPNNGTSEPRFAPGFGAAVTAGIEVASPKAANGNTNGNGHGPERVESDGESDGEPGTFVSLRVLTASARRHWRPLVAVALIGLVIGAGLHTVVPRKYAATTTLYLSEPAASDPAQGMANDVSLLQTRAVAQRAMATLHLGGTTTSFLTSYQGVALSNAVMVITVGARSPAQAVSRADAVASAFLAVRTELVRLQTQVVVSGLNGQVGTLDGEVNNLTQSINALSAHPTATSSGSELANLVDQRSEDTSQVAALESQIQQEQLSETSVNQASLVLDRGAAVKVSATKVTAMDALSGLVGGLGLALVMLVVGVLLSDRVRNRADVASTLGAPVELSLFHWASRRQRRTRHRRDLVMHPTPALAMIERRLRAHLESAGGSALGIVEVDAAEPSAVAVAALAFSLASEGRRVVIADMADKRPVASLFGVASGEKNLHTVTLEDQSFVLMVAPDDLIEIGRGWAPKGDDVLLVLASPDPVFGSQHLAAWVAKAVVVVNMKRANAAAVRATGELLRQARIVIRSAILVGTDPKDDDSVSVAPSNHLTENDHHAMGVLHTTRR